MDLEAFQQCRSLVGWVPQQVRSESDPERVYIVLVNPYGDIRQNVCECRGFYFRRYCKHQVIARRQLCAWDETVLQAEQQEGDQRKAMVCPRCGGGTMWNFREKEDCET